jgi:hypothetical protein
MLFTVSTVKDSPANVERFVERNLAGGADHLFLFLDAPDAEVEKLLADHPHVTAVVCDDGYWQGRRPDELNMRQKLNSNLVNGALAPFGWAEWLFHIDADEVVDIDRERLRTEVPAEQRFVVLESMEAVSRWHAEDEEPLLKRLLTRAELNLLVALGVIDNPDNRSYFRGHTHGKLGVRPALELQLQLHRVVTEELEPLTPVEADWLRVRHYESTDGEEFVRKWMAHVSAGTLQFRGNRQRLFRAIALLLRTEGLSEERRRLYLRRLYERWVEDDVETLGDLGLLVPGPPGPHTPEAFPEGARDDLDRVWDLVVACDKRFPHPRHRRRPMVDLLDEVGRRLEGPVAAVVDAEVARARAARQAEVEAAEETARLLAEQQAPPPRPGAVQRVRSTLRPRTRLREARTRRQQD